MHNKAKLLMISYSSFLQKYYQTLPCEIKKQTDWNVKVLVPAFWKEKWSGGKIFLEKDRDDFYDIIIGKILYPGNLHFSIFLTQLKNLLKNFQPDIIDLEDEPFNLGSYQIVNYRNRYASKSKIVLHASQNKLKHYPPPFNFIEKYVLRRVDAILARNQMAINVLKQKGYQGLLFRVTHGVDTHAFHPREQPNLCHKLNPERKLIIGFVGALVEHKGVHHLIEALEGIDCKLILVGNGRFKENLQQLSKLKGVDTEFILSASHLEVAHYMNCMDIFVLPSLTHPKLVEKFGRVLIEAMASGIPIIGSDSGEIPIVIGNAGLIFKEGDVSDLHNKILTLMKNSEQRSKLGQLARSRAQNLYSWNKIAKQTIEVYHKLLGNTAEISTSSNM
jgi:glycosyltransferase involved in cell wall biosynthesis